MQIVCTPYDAVLKDQYAWKILLAANPNIDFRSQIELDAAWFTDGWQIKFAIDKPNAKKKAFQIEGVCKTNRRVLDESILNSCLNSSPIVVYTLPLHQYLKHKAQSIRSNICFLELRLWLLFYAIEMVAVDSSYWKTRKSFNLPFRECRIKNLDDISVY